MLDANNKIMLETYSQVISELVVLNAELNDKVSEYDALKRRGSIKPDTLLQKEEALTNLSSRIQKQMIRLIQQSVNDIHSGMEEGECKLVKEAVMPNKTQSVYRLYIEKTLPYPDDSRSYLVLTVNSGKGEKILSTVSIPLNDSDIRLFCKDFIKPLARLFDIAFNTLNSITKDLDISCNTYKQEYKQNIKNLACRINDLNNNIRTTAHLKDKALLYIIMSHIDSIFSISDLTDRINSIDHIGVGKPNEVGFSIGWVDGISLIFTFNKLHTTARVYAKIEKSDLNPAQTILLFSSDSIRSMTHFKTTLKNFLLAWCNRDTVSIDHLIDGGFALNGAVVIDDFNHRFTKLPTLYVTPDIIQVTHLTY